MYHANRLASCAVALIVAVTPAVAVIDAYAADSPKDMALRGIMGKLGRDMQSVTGAISKEDWATVSELAPGIARHAEPPLTEKTLILRWLGTSAGAFRGFDSQVHEAAEIMAEAARRGDGDAVIAAFSKIQQGCFACHRAFRASFQEHFYEKR